MDLERLKQLEMEYAEQHKDTQPDSFEAYIQMPRQQRRAYQRRLEKEMRRNNINH